MATYQTPLERLLDGVEDIPLRNEINSIINMLEIEKLQLIAELDELEREREGLLNLVSYHKEKQKDAEDKNEPYRHQNKRYREALEFYANQSNWMNIEVPTMMDGEPEMVTREPLIFDDGGRKAREALEGEGE